MIIDMFMIIIKLENLRKNIETTKDEETIHKLTIVVISIFLHSHKVTTLFFSKSTKTCSGGKDKSFSSKPAITKPNLSGYQHK